MADQHSGDSPVLGVCCDEVLRVGRELVLLTAAQTEFTNLRDKGPQISFPDHQLGGSFAAFKDGASCSSLEDCEIRRCAFNTEQSSWAHSLLRLMRVSHYKEGPGLRNDVTNSVEFGWGNSNPSQQVDGEGIPPSTAAYFCAFGQLSIHSSRSLGFPHPRLPMQNQDPAQYAPALVFLAWIRARIMRLVSLCVRRCCPV